MIIVAITIREKGYDKVHLGIRPTSERVAKKISAFGKV